MTSINSDNFFLGRGEVFLKDRERFIMWLAQALYYGDEEEMFKLIRSSLKLVNKEELSKKSNVPIATIYRMMNSENFRIKSLLRVLKTISTHY
ncbi:MAG: hypothetical protein KC493_02060 [Bacteriovoracaceae bacterium]|nr:hypothetical protein [Bacteriovoracaceae bacterium]